MAKKKLNIISMTGYGRSIVGEGKNRVSVELRSVNQRFLKIFIKAPAKLAFLEEKIKAVIKENIKRGSVDVFINCQNGDSVSYLAIDENAVENILRDWGRIQKKFKIPGEINIGLLAQTPSVYYQQYAETSEKEVWPPIEAALKKAIKNVSAMRLNEGIVIGNELIDYIKEIADIASSVKKLAPRVSQLYQEKLKKRIEKLSADSGIEAHLAKVDIAREVALFADRCDVSEELSRLNSHIAQFREAIAVGGPVGKKLDFLVQEMNREANTLSSKAQDAEISSFAISIKDILEKIREQVQNLE